VCDARDARSRRRSIDRSRRRRVEPRRAYIPATTNLERRFDGARDRAIAADAARATDDSARRTATRDRVNARARARTDAKKSSGARDRAFARERAARRDERRGIARGDEDARAR